MARMKKPTNQSTNPEERASKRGPVSKGAAPKKAAARPLRTGLNEQNGRARPARDSAVHPERKDHERSKTSPEKNGAEEGAPVIEEEEFLEKDEPEVEEPNPAAVGEDWADLALEDPLEALGPSMVAIELSEDPVRLYLKEIGQINLLDADSEFRLAARIEADRHLDTLSNHVLADNALRYRQMYLTVAREMITAWARMLEDAQSIQQGETPDLSLILSEAQMLRRQWQADEPSYLRTYLDNGLWGKDTLWDGLVRHAFIVFMSVYLMPTEVAAPMMTYLQREAKLPELEFFNKHLPGEVGAGFGSGCSSAARG